MTSGKEWECRVRWRLVSYSFCLVRELYREKLLPTLGKIIMILLCFINSNRLSKLNWVTSTPRNPSLSAVAKQKMSEERVETLRLAVKHALKRSHNNGLVFGDLRPPNVMITKDGSQYTQAIRTTHVSAPDSFLVGTIHTHLYNWCQQLINDQIWNRTWAMKRTSDHDKSYLLVIWTWVYAECCFVYVSTVTMTA